jgi:hypothetical protein
MGLGATSDQSLEWRPWAIRTFIRDAAKARSPPFVPDLAAAAIQ